MRNGYVSQRGNSWSRNANTVRHETRALGPIALMITVGISLVCLALIAASQSTKANSFDYAISSIESEISELTSKKEDLAVEKARLTSIAASEKSEVAAQMAAAEVSGYASE